MSSTQCVIFDKLLQSNVYGKKKFCLLSEVFFLFTLTLLHFVLVCFSVKEASVLSNTSEHLVYVFGSEGVEIIDPRSKKVLHNITDDICTKSNNRFSR